jgi:hypothetical protein
VPDADRSPFEVSRAAKLVLEADGPSYADPWASRCSFSERIRMARDACRGPQGEIGMRQEERLTA